MRGVVKMKLAEIRSVTVLGAGIMGHGIAQSFLMGGYPVFLYDIQDAILDTAKEHIAKNLELFRKARIGPDRDPQIILRDLTTSSDLAKAVKESDFIIEAAPEELKIKQTLFQNVESHCKTNAILASNTSSLTLKEIGLGIKNKTRLVTTHWFNPPHIVPTVEVVRGDQTNEETVEVTYQLLDKIGKVPVKINYELPGFLINRIQIAMLREVFDLYEKGIASAADIDRAVKGSFGFRLASIGPLLTADLGGLDVYLKVCENLYPRIQSSVELPQGLRRLVTEGHYGIKTGKGFYDYDVDFSKSEFDQVIQKRDNEFLSRLKCLYAKISD
jgi:3-hydroxyacyl-CoA dehydrogenase